MSLISSENDSVEIDIEMCGNLTAEYKTVWKNYEYWCEGVLFSSLGLFGKKCKEIYQELEIDSCNIF